MLDSADNLKVSPHTIDFFALMDWTSELYGEEVLSPQVRRKYWTARMKKYPRVIEKIRRELRGQRIFVSISIVPYQRGSTIYYEDLANVIVGPLARSGRRGSRRQCFLLKSTPFRHTAKHCPKTFLCDLFNAAMNLLWPNNVDAHRADVLLLLTERGSSTFWRERLQVAATELSAHYPNMIHQSCVATLLKQLKDNIRAAFTEVNQLYVHMRNYLHFSLNAKHFYATTQLPKVPNGFLDACQYYLKYFDLLKSFWIDATNFDEYDDYSHLQTLFTDWYVLEDLKFIVQHCTRLTQVRRLVHKRPGTVPLVETIKALEEFRSKMNLLAEWNWELKQAIVKFNQEINYNFGYAKLLLIAKVLDGHASSAVEVANLSPSLSRDELQLFACAPLGAVNRRHCFPRADKAIRARLDSFPLRYIDCTSVNYCFYKVDKQKRANKLQIIDDRQDLEQTSNPIS